MAALAVIEGGRQVAPLRNVKPEDVLERYLAGENSPEIAKSLGVTKQALSFWLLNKAENEWKSAQLVRALERKDKAELLMESADNALDLARAREQLKSAQWDLERVCRRIYGQDQPPAGAGAVQININLRGEAATNAVQHEVFSDTQASVEDK